MKRIKVDDTEVVIWIHISTDRQYNGYKMFKKQKEKPTCIPSANV
jgi:hypothetical protein